MNKNSNLHKAKKEKNDEFYTQTVDIENELKHYRKQFKNKVVYCNCDDPTKSNFWLFFVSNFEFIGLKKLISTHYVETGNSYKLEIVLDDTGKLDTVKTMLEENGDFRSDECVELLKESDIVVSNPPFSLFREYIAQIVKYDKKLLIIGNKNAITYKETFALINDEKLWLGITSPKEFVRPNGELSTNMGGLTRWFTNLEHKDRNDFLDLYKNYNPQDYPKYNNFDVINVDKVKEIPQDYMGVMGVPITFLTKHNPKQFKILGLCNSARFLAYECLSIIGERKVYNRIIIKRITK